MRIFVPQSEEDSEIFIEGDDARHLFALRPQPKDKVICGDGKAFIYEAEIGSVKKDGLFIKIGKKIPIEKRKTEITLFQAFLKGDKNEFVIQKATELGIDRITFFSSENCVVKLDDKKKAQKKDRFEKIARQAAMQCERETIPEITDFIDFNDMPTAAAEKNGIFFYEKAFALGKPLLSSYLSENKLSKFFSFTVGPEGGFSLKEVNKASERLPIISLGKRILRAETVPLTALSLIAAASGEI